MNSGNKQYLLLYAIEPSQPSSDMYLNLMSSVKYRPPEKKLEENKETEIPPMRPKKPNKEIK